MKYLKKIEEVNPFTVNERLITLKELLSHIIKVFNELGFDNKNYWNNSKYEVEFRNKKHLPNLWNIEMYIDYFVNKIILKITNLNNNSIIKFIPEYFKTIDGVKFLDKDKYTSKFEINFNIDIKQINKKDFEFKLKADEYNL